MASSVTVWVRIDPAVTNAAALAANDAVPAIVPLVIRLHPYDAGDILEEFSLPYNPIQLRYGSLGDEISQIPRPGTTPIVAFKSHRLLTIDFQFVLAQPGDGLATSVDDKLQILRRFAANGHRVISLANFDALTNIPHKFRNSFEEARTDGLFFNIVEMGVEVMRRNKSNQVTQANVSLSLVENRNPKINIVSIKPIEPRFPEKKCKNGKQKRPNTSCAPNTKSVTIQSLVGLTKETAYKRYGTDVVNHLLNGGKGCYFKEVPGGQVIERCP